jgi:hypothetical protein
MMLCNDVKHGLDHPSHEFHVSSVVRIDACQDGSQGGLGHLAQHETRRVHPEDTRMNGIQQREERLELNVRVARGYTRRIKTQTWTKSENRQTGK